MADLGVRGTKTTKHLAPYTAHAGLSVSITWRPHPGTMNDSPVSGPAVLFQIPRHFINKHVGESPSPFLHLGSLSSQFETQFKCQLC